MTIRPAEQRRRSLNFQKQTGDLKVDLTAVKDDVALVKWILGFVLASNVAILFKVFS